ncbi:MAG: DUF2809 domain-containing protein [Polaribacter sp.]
MISFNKKYFICFIIIFITEIAIAKYATGFLRHTIGDVLAVILLYCFIKGFFKISIYKTAIIVLIIAFVIEFLQLSGLQHMYPKRAENYLKIILGTSFSIGDLIAYIIGTIIILVFENKINISS